jgi:CPA1 family monovalent cation:H+ antiporter
LLRVRAEQNASIAAGILILCLKLFALSNEASITPGFVREKKINKAASLPYNRCGPIWMTAFQIIALLISLTALFSYLNYRWFSLPATIGVMLIALLVSLGLIATRIFTPSIEHEAAQLLKQIDFDDTLMQGMLCFLLFAGALHINLNDLAEQRGVISTLAIAGVIISMLVFGTAIHFALGWLGLPLSYSWCLLFGALISPTDPVAVIGILKEAKVPHTLETQIAGESLFNDGIGVVAFIVLHEIAVGGEKASAGHIVQLFLEEAVGGAVFGLVVGWVTYRLLKSVDNYRVEVMLTLALVMGGYALASAIHTSGPIAIVVAGLFIGNHGRAFAMSETTRKNLDTFWELIDEILNALLFVLIGLEVLVLTFTRDLLFAGLLAIPAILIARWVSVAGPVTLMSRQRTFTPGAVTIMTWGGLRGGISVALALSLPAGREREIVLAVTYIVVVFSILVQGLTIKRVVRRLVKR